MAQNTSNISVSFFCNDTSDQNIYQFNQPLYSKNFEQIGYESA
jgi:hypothetical protein